MNLYTIVSLQSSLLRSETAQYAKCSYRIVEQAMLWYFLQQKNCFLDFYLVSTAIPKRMNVMA